MADLVPLRVKIGLRADGSADYPDFSQLPSVQASGMDWSRYIDRFGPGWIYDRVSGHKDDDPESPLGNQLGLLLVPKAFADEASATFPATCQKMSEAQCQAFYEQRYAVRLTDEVIDQDVLDVIREKKALSLPLTAEQQLALDPTSDVRGIRQNKMKKWQSFKATKKITVIQ